MELKGTPIEISQSIPPGWKLCPVGKMGQVVTGKALAKNAPGEQRPYLRTKNVFDGRIDIEDILTMPMTDVEFDHFQVVAGDVLLNEGQSLELVGRCAIYNDEYPHPCAIQNQLIRFRVRQGVCGTFASHLFRYCQQTGVFAKIALKTTSIAHLGGRRFENLELPWPVNEAEQRAIATALSDVDALLEGLDRLITKKRNLKQATMQQLLTGDTRLPGYTGEWETVPLRSIADIRSGGTPSTSKRDFWDGGIPWCTPTDITALHGRKYLTTTERTISSAGLRSSSAELVPPHSVIMTSRATIGECAINTVPMSTNQGFKNLIPTGFDGEYLYYLMTTQKSRLIQLCGGSTFLEVGKKQLQQFEVMLPGDIDEQKAIATILSDMDAEIEALEQRRAKTADLKQAMMQELLTGKTRLVEPQASDEEVHAASRATPRDTTGRSTRRL